VLVGLAAWRPERPGNVHATWPSTSQQQPRQVTSTSLSTEIPGPGSLLFPVSPVCLCHCQFHPTSSPRAVILSPSIQGRAPGLSPSSTQGLWKLQQITSLGKHMQAAILDACPSYHINFAGSAGLNGPCATAQTSQRPCLRSSHDRQPASGTRGSSRAPALYDGPPRRCLAIQFRTETSSRQLNRGEPSAYARSQARRCGAEGSGALTKPG
jgi:hypothetical protein